MSIRSVDDEPTLPRVLVVDDDPDALTLVKVLLAPEPLEVVATPSPVEALRRIRAESFPVVISDHLMPGLTGLELLSLARQHRPETVALMMTACGDVGVAAEAVNRQLVRFFVTKPLDPDTFVLLVRDAVALAAAARGTGEGRAELRAEAGRAIFSLARAVDARDRYTLEHSDRVSVLAERLGRRLGLGSGRLDVLRVGALLHDLGKIGIPDSLLRKEGGLDTPEVALMRGHPMAGGAILEPLDLPAAVLGTVVNHHENVDGSGYPRGLDRDAIPLEARIVRVADSWDAMASDRVYRAARSPEFVADELRRGRGGAFDPEVVEAALAELSKTR